MVVRWTEFAENKLKQVFDYYLDVAGYVVAEKMVTKIKKSSELLEVMPLMAPVEEELQNYKFAYRSLVVGSIFKVVYFIDEPAECVVIATLWDCRQDPDKLQREIY